jgi:hypothetical protein
MPSRRRAIVVAALVLGLAILLALLAAWRAPAIAVARVEDAWTRTHGSADAFVERLPEVETNRSADVLDELAAAVDAAAVDDALEAYLDGAIATEDGALVPPPPDLDAWLLAHAVGVEAAILHLAEAEAPSWESHPRRAGGSLPPTHRGLHAVLLAETLRRASAGDGDLALEVLDAAWSLDRAVLAAPHSVLLVQAAEMARKQCAVLRRLGAVPEAWQRRLAAFGLAGPMRRAVEREAWLVLDEARRGDPGPTAAWRRTCLADAAARTALLASSWESERGCTVSPGAAREIGRALAPRWNRRATAKLAPAAWALALAHRAEVDVDLARHVLWVGSMHARGDRPPERTPARGCPGLEWVTTVDATGGLAVVPSGAVPPGPEGFARIPLAWRARRE